MRYSIITLAILAIPALAFSATLKVPSQYPKIQDAIDAASGGDTVLVEPGTYVENIDFKGKAITAKGEQGASVTIIDGCQAGSVVTCQSGEGPDSVLDGFTITNGSGTKVGWDTCGGGMFNDKSSPTVINCIFSGNSVNGYPYDGKGGGMYNELSTPTVTNCCFTGNSAEYGGGGMCNDEASATVTNCCFAGNSADYGGGIYNGKCIPIITNCIFWENSTEIYNGNADPILTYCDVKGGYPGIGNIDSDPFFIDSVNGDFHLTFNSPCRDTGDNTAVTELYDFEGDPRIAYGTVDMGADEFYTHLYWTGDATPGGNVEIKFVGLPGTSPVGLCIGIGVLDPPLKSMWGDWYLQFPIIGPIDLGAIPSPDGVLVIPGMIPAMPPPPYLIPMQALIGAELSNLCVMEVK